MKVKLRMPNELFFEGFDIDPKHFVVDSKFDDQVFGKYRGMTVAMDIEILIFTIFYKTNFITSKLIQEVLYVGVFLTTLVILLLLYY